MLVPVVEDLFSWCHLCSCSWERLHEARGQWEDVIADEVVVDVTNWIRKVEGTTVKCLFQFAVLPNFGIAERSWLTNVNEHELVVGVHQGKENNGEVVLVVVEQRA